MATSGQDPLLFAIAQSDVNMANHKLLNLDTSNLSTLVQASQIDTDGTLSADSDTRVASQKATKTYADTKLPPLVPTAVKNGAYNAQPTDFVPVDTTGGAVTITLPTAPADQTRIGIKMVIQGGTNAVTIARGGSDVFNKTGGATSLTLALLFQGVLLQYQASTSIWYVQADDLPLGQLDTRYQAALGFTAENVANKSNNTALGTSTTLYPTQNAAKVYADTKQTALGFTPENVANKGAASGYCPLDGSSKVPAGNLPTLSSGTIASTSALLKGDGAGNAVAATQTGSGSAVLATSPTLVTPTIGAATATTVNKWTFTAPATGITIAGTDTISYVLPPLATVGYMDIPTNSQSAPYTTVIGDCGKCLLHPATDANNRTFTIDSHTNVTWRDGSAIMFENMSANTLSIAITTDTMYLAGAGTTGTRSLAQYGRALARYTLATTSWVISGVGLS